MKIVLKDSFFIRLKAQIKYIALDNPKAAKKFKDELFNQLKKIPNKPLSYRKSIYFEDESIRDLVFKGYTIVFRINSDCIEIFGFVHYQKDPIDA